MQPFSVQLIATVDTGKLIFATRTAINDLLRPSWVIPVYPNAAPTENSLAPFQRAVEIIISRAKWQLVVVYLDHIVVYLKYVTECLVHMRTTRMLLRVAGVILKLSKCSLFESTVSYMEHKIRSGKRTVDSKSCKPVCNSLSTINLTKLRSIWEMCNV